jgi:hypothetical protein
MFIQININILFNNKKFLEWYFIICVNFLKQKFQLLSLLNDLGINKVPKENKNKNNTFQILDNIILN